jgi:hypothetical protein
MTRSLIALLALVLLCVPAQATPVSMQKPTLDSRIDVRLEATPVADAFRQIINGLGYELQMDAALDAPVTLWVTHVSARTALNVLCESVGCQWRVDGTRLVVSQPVTVTATSGRGQTYVGIAGKSKVEQAEIVKKDLLDRLRKPLPVDMQFQDVAVSTILRAMSEVSGLEIKADEPLASKRVTLTGTGNTVEDALKAIIKEAGGWAVTAQFRRAGDSSTPMITLAIGSREPKK